MNRRDLRENVFKLIFVEHFHEESSFSEQIEIFSKENEISDEDKELIENRVSSVFEKIPEIDDMIQKASKNWTIDRMALVDKSLLRLVIFEAIFDEKIPVGVALNEGIELAKKYGSKKSAKFINGVAGKVING